MLSWKYALSNTAGLNPLLQRDEDAVDINHLSRKQLLVCGPTATIEQRHESNDDFDPSNSDIEDCEPVSKKKRKAKKPKWKKCSLTKDKAVERFPWKNPLGNLDYDFSPCKLFEEFLTDEILSHICQETIRYAMSKGRENFTIDLHSLKRVYLHSSYKWIQCSATTCNILAAYR